MIINYSNCYNAYFLDYIFKDLLEYSICISIYTYRQNLDFFYIGFMNENEEITSTGNCFCSKPKNSFYIRIDSEQIYQGKESKYKVKIEDKTNLSLKFILNLKTKKLDIINYDSNISYGIIDVIGNQFRFFVGKCNEGKIEYSLFSKNI